LTSVISEDQAEFIPMPPFSGENQLDEEDPRRPCGQHYKMLIFKVRQSGVIKVKVSPCGETPLFHPLFMLFYGKGMGGVRLAISDCTGDGGATAAFYATGGELYTAVFTSYLPGEEGSFSFSLQ
jgi:hypothetical protein